MNKCPKKCTCDNCEMFSNDEEIVYITSGFPEKRRVVSACRCNYRGVYALHMKLLKNSDLYDDLIFL